MTTYSAPLRDMQFVINELAGLKSLAALPGYEEVTPELAEAVLEEAARLASEVLAPLNKPGDERGASLTKDGVVAADGFGAAYRRFVDNGWNGLGGDPEYGGQGLRGLVAAAAVEMWNSANMSFALCPLLTAGGDGGDQGARFRRAEEPLSAKARQRRVVGHDESDRTAGRFRLSGGPDQGHMGFYTTDMAAVTHSRSCRAGSSS
jgi:alkylation response protein AidB-like acyl-CoA dehydrogenase